MAPSKAITGPKPWERRKGESNEAHAAYLEYQDFGPGRSVERLALEHGGTTSSRKRLQEWCAKYGWVERARQYDSHLADVEQSAKDEVIAARAKTWEERKDVAREETYQLLLQIQSRLREMLAFPIKARTVNRKNGEVTIKPIRWNYGNVANLLRTVQEAQDVLFRQVSPPAQEDERQITINVAVEQAINRIYGEPAPECSAEFTVVEPEAAPPES